MRSVLIPLLVWTTAAHAVPAQFTHQGRLLDADGVPLDDEVTLIFRIATEDSGGDTLWEDTFTLPVENGFYSAVLGADEADNPLDVEILSQAPVWLEIQVDGEAPMFPRSPIQAVPYAAMAQVAEEVSGGPVDATEVAIDGGVVINDAGEWVGPAPSVSWSDLTDIPTDFADGVDDDTDTDTDSFADLGTSCLDGNIPVWDAVVGAWGCGTDAVLTEDDVDAMVADNGYAMASDVFSGSFDDLADVPDYAMASDVFSGSFSDLADVPDGLADGDDNTQLTEEEVDAYVSDNGYALATDAFSGSFEDLADVPDGLGTLPALEPLPASSTSGHGLFNLSFHEFIATGSGLYNTIQVRTDFVDDDGPVHFAIYRDEEGLPGMRVALTTWYPDYDTENERLVSIPFSVTLERNEVYHLMVVNRAYTRMWGDVDGNDSWVGSWLYGFLTYPGFDMSGFAGSSDYYKGGQNILWFRLLP